MRFKMIYALAAVAALQTVPANAATFTNGSFEAGTLVNPYSTVAAGQTNITGWDVVSGSVDYIGNLWTAEDGSRSVDLAGSSIGTLSQTFDTVSGLIYNVSFYLARNPDGGIMPRTGTVQATGNSTKNLIYTDNSSTRSAMDWQLNSYQFTATGASTTLTFAADASSSGFYGLALDNVSVAAVPELSTWAMMLLGFGFMGFAMRRQPRRAVRIRFA
jgi:choice-of-anchor C domain-containing protein